MNGHLTGRGVLIWLFAFFGVILAVNSYFITVSTSTFRGEDEQKPYLQGVEYNQTLARHAAQAALGWQAAITATRLPGGDVRVEIQMRDTAGKPVAEPGLAGELRHPSDENRDRDLHLAQTAPGLYEARLSGVSPGVWDVMIHSSSERTPFDAERRLWVR
jgi:nitrogen fixation protein FixH